MELGSGGKKEGRRKDQGGTSGKGEKSSGAGKDLTARAVVKQGA